MNATRWETLSGFIQYLGKAGKCVVDRTEKGWYIAWIDRDPETIARQEALAKRDKMAKDDEERLAEFISKQVEKGAGESSESSQATELMRFNEEEKISLNFSTTKHKSTDIKPGLVKPTFKVPDKRNIVGQKKDIESKRKKSALDEIMETELAQKKKRVEEDEKNQVDEAADPSDRPWLRKGIVVKVVTKSLGEKYYKQKGHIREVVGDDRMAAVVQMINTGSKVKLDQSHLETVVPSTDRPVLILIGKHRGKEAVLRELDIDNFCAKLKIAETGEKVSLPYEHFSKLHSAST